ncbi:hypothetical protein CEXT_622571 [Caerostris extrusa]|uniref:Uncharacterized protein n=1 Tax=Caerostris extrusa TaxID=172846 RepID=A0AAV4RH24_CAEEX|nr:hypothetical protein CEXT_622571 [Caerostris extrusa]
MDSPTCNMPWGIESTSKDVKEGLSTTNNSSNSSDSSKSEKRADLKGDVIEIMIVIIWLVLYEQCKKEK